MRIRELHIEGFGHFANRKWGPFDRPVTVFHGPNEAGKSTLEDVRGCYSELAAEASLAGPRNHSTTFTIHWKG